MKISIQSPLVGAAVALALATATQVASGADYETASGVYVGGGITQSRFDSDTFTLDHKDHGWKAIVGTRIIRNLALEANYVDFGKAQAPAAALVGPTGTSASAISAFALAVMPVGMADLYAKAGAVRARAKGQIGGERFTDHSMGFAYGAGVAFNFARFSVRAEYEKYDVSSIRDLDLITLAATYTFSVR